MRESSEPPAKINLADPDLCPHGDPHAVWRWFQKHDSVHWHPPPGDFPGYSAGVILLRAEAFGVDPGGDRTLSLTDPPHHRKLQALVDDWFTYRFIRLLEAETRDILHDVVTHALERERCDFVTEIAARVPLYIICKMMGVPRSDWEHIFSHANMSFGADGPMEQRTARLGILQYFEDIVAARAKSPADDLVSVLATARIDGG